MNQKLTVGLFVTCLVDLFRPQVAFACLRLLESANCRVVIPSKQTCCGQPAYNNGDQADTKRIAQQVIHLFKDIPYVVVPSGSCTGMIKKHYPHLFSDEVTWYKQAKSLAERTFEIVSFLTDVLKFEHVDATYPYRVTYHDACAGLRELGISQQPRTLLAKVKQLQLQEQPDANICCGFGGTFCVKFPAISNKMVADKVACIETTGAQTVLAGDLGCLMNMIGKLQRMGSTIKAYHIAEVLADMGKGPGYKLKN